MTCHRQPHIDRCFDMDEATSNIPPRRHSNAQECAPGYLWNSTTQELIPILPEDHPDYRQNRETSLQRSAAGIEEHHDDRPANCGR
jgi:hypothetical protein